MKSLRKVIIIFLVVGLTALLLASLLHTQPDQNQSKSDANITSTVIPDFKSTLAQAVATPTITTDEVISDTTPTVQGEGNTDEMSTLIPAVTVNPNLTTNLITPKSIVDASPTAYYFGSLTTPPPTLGLATPAPTSSNISNLPHNSFVIATNDGVYWLGTDGKNPHQIIGNARYSQPKVSPDGGLIAVLKTDPINRKQRLYLVNIDGSEKLAFENQEDVVTLNAAWSPDGKTLALTRAADPTGTGSVTASESPAIWLYNLDTQKLREVANGRDPVWSPDGARIAFIVPGPTSSEIDPTTHQPILSANNISIYNLQQDAKRVLLGSDGLQIALNQSTADPTLASQKTNVRYFKQLNWSPDGKLIGASADGVTLDGRKLGLILTLSIDNTTPQLVTTGNQAAAFLSWSPDGKVLAFEGQPQFPVTSESSHNIGLLPLPSKPGPAVTKIFLGEAINRTEDKSPHWILGGQELAFIEGDFDSLAFVNNKGDDKHLLVSGCNGFDWFQ